MKGRTQGRKRQREREMQMTQKADTLFRGPLNKLTEKDSPFIRLANWKTVMQKWAVAEGQVNSTAVTKDHFPRVLIRTLGPSSLWEW